MVDLDAVRMRRARRAGLPRSRPRPRPPSAGHRVAPPVRESRDGSRGAAHRVADEVFPTEVIAPPCMPPDSDQPTSDGRVVGRDHDCRRARRPPATSTSITCAPWLRVELTGGFVGEDQRRPAGQDASDCHALGLTSGELFGPFRTEAGDVESAQGRLRGPRASASSKPPRTSGSATFSMTSSAGAGWGPGRPCPRALDVRWGRRPTPARARFRSWVARAQPSGAAAWTCRNPTGRREPPDLTPQRRRRRCGPRRRRTAPEP